MDYFKAAVDIVRQHETDRKTGICRCDAYKFPHRKWSGSCEGENAVEYATDSMSQWDREELQCFDRAEANAINSGRGGF